MKKLPVAETIRFAYAFAFGQIGTIIGLIWAPMVVIAVLRFLPYGMGDVDISPQADPRAAGAAGLRDLLFMLASVLLYACISVAVIRQALGLRSGPAVFHFSLGRPEFRLAGATLVLGVILMVLLVASAFAALVAGSTVANAGDKQLGNAVGAVTMLAGMCVFLYALVRLSFVYVPASVVENKLGLEQSWNLTTGNFWRASAVLFVVTLPAVVILFGSFFALMGRELQTLIPVAASLTPDALSARIDAIVERHIGPIIGINLILAPFSIGLTLGAAAQGYRALGGGAPAAAPTPPP